MIGSPKAHSEINMILTDDGKLNAQYRLSFRWPY